MIRRTTAHVLLGLACAGSACLSWAGQRPVVQIGIVYDGPPPDESVLSLQRFLDLPSQIRDEIRKLTEREFDVRFPDDKQRVADWTLAGVHTTVDRLLADPGVDVLIALGVLSSNDLGQRRSLAKPAIAAIGVDPAAQALPISNDASGVSNLNYLVRRGNLEQDLRKFRELIPFSRVHVIADETLLQAIPAVEFMTRLSGMLGIETVVVPVGDTADEALERLDGAEAVYVTPTLRMPTTEFDRMVQELTRRRLPSFSLLGEAEVERGVLASLRRKTDTSRLARRVALNVQRILLGDDAGSLPVVLSQPERLMINMDTARAIGYHPRWRVTLEADLIGAENLWGGHDRIGEPLSLSAAVLEAVEANLELEAFDRAVAAGAQDVALARSRWLPRLDLGLSGVLVDEDSVAASFGSLAERTLTGDLSLRQSLWSENVRADLDATRAVQRSRELDRETTRLDVALDAANAFLDVLRAQTLERVALENLRLTEENLELARRRERIGVSGPADGYRWESELATDRSAVIAAHNRAHTAFLSLNQVLRRPLGRIYDATPPRLDNPRLVTGFGRLNRYIDNRTGFELFQEFAVSESLERATELKSLAARIAALSRQLIAERRAFWSPEVGLAGSLERTFSRDGESATALGTPPRDGWSLAIQANLPLSVGGARLATVRQTSDELARLRTEYQALAQAVELRTRAALYRVGSSYPAIELAHEASAAAGKNLELVTDAYSRGLVSVIDLLDAQTAALVAEESASNATYDFLIDLMGLQRATSDLDFFRSDEGRDAWFDRLEAFFDDAGFEFRWLRGDP